jgi:hypothetical protein
LLTVKKKKNAVVKTMWHGIKVDNSPGHRRGSPGPEIDFKLFSTISKKLL